MSRSTFPDVSPAVRKAMQANKGKDTKPEMAVRRIVHGMGYRYRLHRTDLPGKPDLVFGPRRKVVFVHGCFWHCHEDPACKAWSLPKTRPDYWQAKFTRNRDRDRKNIAHLEALGWGVLILWECGIEDPVETTRRVRAFLTAA